MTEHRRSEFSRIARRVWHELSAAGFRGTDPYDGLNSRVLHPLLKRSRVARLAVIQAVKRAPFDLRPVLGVPRGLNPKGLALVLQGAAEWSELGDTSKTMEWLADALISTASLPNGNSVTGSRSVREGAAQDLLNQDQPWPDAVGWGYHFPWQSKAFLQPAYYPTVVATSFVLDGLELARSSTLEAVATATGCFVADFLHRHEDADGICFSYSPNDHTRVYNASLFGARILAQSASFVPARAEEWRSLAKRAVDWVVSRQRHDGSWLYGEAPHWQWVDNLHTGFNLETIHRTGTLLECTEWDECVARGLAFYRQNLFLADGTPRYYTTSQYPLDPHSFAQGALTFLRLQEVDSGGIEFAGKILERGISELWDERRGGFQFQKHRHYAQPSIHMRWSQAWMFRALSAYLGRRS